MNAPNEQVVGDQWHSRRHPMLRQSWHNEVERIRSPDHTVPPMIGSMDRGSDANRFVLGNCRTNRLDHQGIVHHQAIVLALDIGFVLFPLEVQGDDVIVDLVFVAKRLVTSDEWPQMAVAEGYYGGHGVRSGKFGSRSQKAV